ncbi:MAG: type II toxin-antitoxin system RelB/DinJ family antitoxin [Candidatus Pacebacteria bacterium]|nr:type II toxin-antitoxin system RelB/DinJ family antitoxin [Candidatus Paceibacterota bacterium]
MSAIINFKTEKKIKSEAQEIAQKMGLSLSDVLNVCLRNFVRDKELSINVEEPSNYMLKELVEAENEVSGGGVSPEFDSAEKAIGWLNKKQ